jgi:hypothetical protein
MKLPRLAVRAVASRVADGTDDKPITQCVQRRLIASPPPAPQSDDAHAQLRHLLLALGHLLFVSSTPSVYK